MSFIRVIAFDDNKRLRHSLSLLFEDAKEFDLIGIFADCSHVLDDIARTKPDVIVMDIDMPGINGIEAVKMIRKSFPEVKILMQTVFDDDEKVFAAIRAGAGGYILKNAQPRLLLEAVREVYNGGAPMTPSIARKVLLQFQTTDETVKEDFNLSSREKEVLALLVGGKSYKMIADELNVTYDTVRSHMKKIYEKLHVSSMTEAVVMAVNRNLV